MRARLLSMGTFSASYASSWKDRCIYGAPGVYCVHEAWYKDSFRDVFPKQITMCTILYPVACASWIRGLANTHEHFHLHIYIYEHLHVYEGLFISFTPNTPPPPKGTPLQNAKLAGG